MIIVLFVLLGYLLVDMVRTYQAVSQQKREERGGVNLPQISKKSSHKWNIQAEIISLPVNRKQYNAWYFTIKPLALINDNGPTALPEGFPKKIRLAWYQSRQTTAQNNPIVPNLGEHWRLWVKLKPIHSQVNPGGFDYEKWAFVKRIDSRGYILNSTKRTQYNNHLIAEKSPDWLSQWRSHLRLHIEKSDISNEAKGLIKALMIGDKSALSQTQWDAFRDAGIAHLLAISGLHIGLVALFMGWLWSRLWRLSARLCRLISAPYIWFISGLCSATIYALIAGFEVPVQRALIMLCVTFIALIYKRHIPNIVILFLAFIAVMLFDIRSFYATGFWLSFTSVAIILLLLRRDKTEVKRFKLTTFNEPTSWGTKWHQLKTTLYSLLRLHLAITVCLIPLLLFFFQTASVISPIANLTMTPLVGIIIIPLIIIAIFLSAFPVIFRLIIEIIGALLTQLNHLLILLVQWLDFRIQLPSPTLWVTMIATALLLFAFIHTDWKKRIGSLLVVILLLYPYPQQIPVGNARINVLDVGQGLSVVVFTKNHSLIYDFGNRGLGRSVVYPFMNANFRNADKVIISHHDIDHYGGAKYVLSKYPNAEKIDWQNCSGQWQWDGVNFQLWQYSQKLQQQNNLKKIKDNNLSCIVKITTANGQNMLLTADIEREAEQWLLKNKAGELASDILLVPHQGSKTSSINAFIQAVNPQIAIVSAGFQNHFRHPHPSVIQRYQTFGIPIYDTICGGMISLELGAEKTLSEKSIQQHRKEKNNFWLRQC